MKRWHSGKALILAATLMMGAVAGLEAHLMTFRGTVAKLEGTRVQVRTVDDNGKENPTPVWFSPNEKTKIMRGDTRVTLAEARIVVGERIVVVVDHRSDDDRPVVEVRLGVRPAAGPPSQTPAWDLRVEPFASPAAANASGQPQLTVSDRGVLMSWVEREGPRATLRFAERTASGWTAPRTVASGDDWFVNWADVPSVLRLTNGTLVAHWLQKSGPGTYAYDVRLSYSKDEGQTWSASFLPHHDGTKTEHGFASLFQMPNAGLGLVWLDGRQMAADTHPAPTGGDHGAGGAMSVRFATFDPTWKQTAEMPVDTRVCECCPTTAAVTSEGVITAFRNRTENEIRDIYVSRFERGAWTEPVAVHADEWKINACPVNGPMLAARGRDVVLAWFTASENQPRTFLAFSSDAGRTFGAPIRLDDHGTMGRVDIELLPDGSALASWIEQGDGVTEFRVRRVERSGATSRPVTVTALSPSRASGYPRAAVQRGEAVFAWTEAVPPQPGQNTNGLRVVTAKATLPVLPVR